MGFFRISQVADKKWMAGRLSDLPGWREISSFDEKQAASYNTELARRLDELAERAATLRFTRKSSWTKLRSLIENQASARYDRGRCYGGNVGIVPRLIDLYIADTRRNPLGVATLAGAAASYTGLVIASAGAGWSGLLWLLVGVPVAVAVVALLLRSFIFWKWNRLIERWFHSVWALISGARDYLEVERFEAMDILAQRWNARNGGQLTDLLDRCIRRHREDPAYHLSVTMALARLGYAAEYLTRRETFAYSIRSLRLIHDCFDSWEELGQALDRSWRRRAERRGEPYELERIRENMDYARRQVWPGARFGLPFGRRD